MTPQHDVRLEVFPRIHLGLISMHADAPRKNGGVGFSVAGPSATIVIKRSAAMLIRDDRPTPLPTLELIRLSDFISRVKQQETLATAGDIRIEGQLRTHVGMGSGTALRLAAIEGLQILNGRSLDQERLIELSGRGGTSGIGINTYFSGGMILDLGIANDGRGHLPSSLVSNPSAPASLPAIAMPDWPLCLCIPRSIAPKTQEEELEFFKRTTPISETSSYRAAYEALFSVYASVLDRQYGSFCQAINRMQLTEWKTCEWDEHGPALKTLRDELLKFGVDCVGMSSLGPMLFCFGSTASLASIRTNHRQLDCDVVCTTPSNRGRNVSLFQCAN